MKADLLSELTRFLTTSREKTVAIVGAGGKTSLMQYLAQNLSGTVVCTTCTKLAASEASLFDKHIVWENEELPEIIRNSDSILVTRLPIRDDGNLKLSGLSEKQLVILKEHCDQQLVPLIVEADGAKRRPLKAPAAWEPVIPFFTDLLLVVVGLRALMKPLDEEILFRSKIFSELTGLAMGELIDMEAILRFLKHPLGGLKGVPDGAKRFVVFNLAGCSEMIDQEWIAKELSGVYDGVFFESGFSS